MGVYEERAPPTTGMHWVSVIPVSALPIGRCAPAGTPRRGGSSSLRLRICDSIFANISSYRIQDGEFNTAYTFCVYQ